MVQFRYTTPGYAEAGQNLGAAIFGGKPNASQVMNDKIQALTAAKKANEAYGQRHLINQLEGVQGNLANVDGGRLALGMALNGYDPKALTAMSIDPRFQEQDMRRISVGAGDALSLGDIASQIGRTQAVTANNMAQADRTRNQIGLDNAKIQLSRDKFDLDKNDQRFGQAMDLFEIMNPQVASSGGKGHKPPRLPLDQLQEIKQSAMQGMNLDNRALQNTMASNPALGQAMVEAIGEANRTSLGNAADMQVAAQQVLSDALFGSNGQPQEAGSWWFLDGAHRYEVNENWKNGVASAADAPVMDKQNQPGPFATGDVEVPQGSQKAVADLMAIMNPEQVQKPEGGSDFMHGFRMGNQQIPRSFNSSMELVDRMMGGFNGIPDPSGLPVLPNMPDGSSPYSHMKRSPVDGNMYVPDPRNPGKYLLVTE